MMFHQRTPWGGGKKRGVENLTNDTPSKKGFWTPPHTVRFPPPSCVSALFFLYRNPRQSRPEALLEGSKNFRESAFSGTFSTPHTFCTPPYHGPISSVLVVSFRRGFFIKTYGLKDFCQPLRPNGLVWTLSVEKKIPASIDQGKKKHINIKKSAGLSRDWVGAKILLMCFFSDHSLCGEKNT